MLKSNYTPRSLILEAFIWANLSFLSVDIWFAHSYNSFEELGEWIPFFFSIGGSLILLPGLLWLFFKKSVSRYTYNTGLLIGYLSIAVGILGTWFHLESHFFQSFTLKSLVYSAPFMAPLAYAGLGFLLVLNRKISSTDVDWARWVIFFGWGGILGNFLLTLCDHAQNGFFSAAEWIPVVVSAIGLGFFTRLLFDYKSKGFVNICLGICVLQAVTGLLGLYFHLAVDIKGAATQMSDLVFGAPVFAPLLFVNLALLLGFGIWELKKLTPELSK